MGKVVVNRCYGGFGLSEIAVSRLKDLGVTFSHGFPQVARHDSRLVQVVEELGDEANGDFARLGIDEFEGDRYIIEEYDGIENVVTPDMIRWIIPGGE